MKEKIKPKKAERYDQGYFKPEGKECKRYIHKLARRMENLDTNKKGIYNRIGVYFEWN